MSEHRLHTRVVLLLERSVSPSSPAPAATSPTTSRAHVDGPSLAQLELALHLRVDPLEDRSVFEHVRRDDVPNLAPADEGLAQVGHAAVLQERKGRGRRAGWRQDTRGARTGLGRFAYPRRGRDILKLAVPIVLGVLKARTRECGGGWETPVRPGEDERGRGRTSAARRSDRKGAEPHAASLTLSVPLNVSPVFSSTCVRAASKKGESRRSSEWERCSACPHLFVGRSDGGRGPRRALPPARSTRSPPLLTVTMCPSAS